MANIVLLLVGPIALDNIQWRFFLVFITVTAANVAFVYFMCPETKGLSLVRDMKCVLSTLSDI